jgi:hypothetical protein
VRYNSTTEAAKFLATTVSGLLDGLPATDAIVQANPCLAKMETVYTLPTFLTEATAYSWALDAILPNTSTTVQVHEAKRGTAAQIAN